MNLKNVARNIGLALLLNAIFMFISAAVSIFYGLDNSFSPLILSGIITSIVASFPLIFVSKSSEINAKEGLVIVVLSWILSCLFGMLPYILYGGEFSIINSWYESVSGYTTTGATILVDVESLPKGLLFWRASTHWLGGMGVVLFMLLILPSISASKMLSKFEISSLSKDNFRFRAQQTVRVISTVYLGLTFLETILLTLAGMDFFDAICHSFATIATGGFSTKNLSLAYYDSALIDSIVMVFMLLSGMHFGLLYSASLGKVRPLWKSPVIRYYLASIFVISLIITVTLKINGIEDDWLHAARHAFFQVISVGTTTGFASADSSIWPSFAILLMIFLTFQCACSGSTTGGIKVDRILIFYKAFKAQVKKQIHPNAVVPVKLGDQVLDREMVTSASLFIVLYISIVFLVTLILAFLGVDLLDAFTASAANMGNVGPGFGTVGSLGNYSQIPAMGKFVLSVQMLMGRVEIYSMLLIVLVFRKR
ncbi:MAG: potassium transporter TrkG [Bacteroidales bacterium]|jgi:trk system potassium uptake protein TrkH|nr:potassium transporter TrkG [Bacteroidales bacterium]